MPHILVINPNSNESVTEGLRQSLAEFSSVADIECCTLTDGPFGIETDDDIAAVIPLVIDKITRATSYDAYVIACYSDPGLADCRNRFDKPVFGMQQSAVEIAVRDYGSFGVLALSDESIARHLAYIEALGQSDALVGELPLDITVDEAANDPATLQKVIAGGQRLVNDFGANSVILGCAGMAAVKNAAEKKLPVPVIEPAQAALDLAMDATR